MTRFNRTCAALLAGLALGGFAALAQAQAPDWPQRPVRVVVPYGPGSSPDILARTVAEPLAADLGQPIVVENKPGAGGNIGTRQATQARPASAAPM